LILRIRVRRVGRTRRVSEAVPVLVSPNFESSSKVRGSMAVSSYETVLPGESLNERTRRRRYAPFGCRSFRALLLETAIVGGEVSKSVTPCHVLRNVIDVGLSFPLRRTLVHVPFPPTHTDEGARAAVTIREQQPEVGVLLLSQVIEAEFALRLFSESPAGFGYLLKDRILDVDDFVDAVRRPPPLVEAVMIHTVSPAPIDQGAEMRHAFMSIDKAFGTYSGGMTRVAERAEPWNRGACRRR
jgi:hypothetical protein